MHTIIIRRPGRARARSLLSALAGAVSSAFGWLLEWQARASERAHLSELSDHVLKDIGLTREQLLYGSKSRQCMTC